MDVERLKEDIRNVEYDLEYGEEQNQGRIAVNFNCLRSVIDFTNEAIARQSVKDEDVAEAISHIQGGYGDVWQWPKNRRDTIITALQAYRPTTRKDRTVEEVAIPKTETTSWAMIDSDINLWKCSKCSEEWNFEFGGPDENNMHFCPNCGRKLN